MKFTAFFTSFLFSSFTWAAGLQGAWQGWGQWTFDGDGPGCPDMRIAFQENTQTLKRLGGYFDCGIAGLDLAEATFEKQNGNLVVDGLVIGAYDGSGGYEYTEPYNEQTNVTTTIKVDGKHFDYQELWKQTDGRLLYRITGRFFFHNDVRTPRQP